MNARKGIQIYMVQMETNKQQIEKENLETL